MTSELSDPLVGWAHKTWHNAITTQKALFICKWGLESWDLVCLTTTAQEKYNRSRPPFMGAQGCPCLSAENINSEHFFLYLLALCNHTYTGTYTINPLYLKLIHATSNNNGVQSVSPSTFISSTAQTSVRHMLSQQLQITPGYVKIKNSCELF